MRVERGILATGGALLIGGLGIFSSDRNRNLVASQLSAPNLVRASKVDSDLSSLKNAQLALVFEPARDLGPINYYGTNVSIPYGGQVPNPYVANKLIENIDSSDYPSEIQVDLAVLQAEIKNSIPPDSSGEEVNKNYRTEISQIDSLREEMTRTVTLKDQENVNDLNLSFKLWTGLELANIFGVIAVSGFTASSVFLNLVGKNKSID